MHVTDRLVAAVSMAMTVATSVAARRIMRAPTTAALLTRRAARATS